MLKNSIKALFLFYLSVLVPVSTLASFTPYFDLSLYGDTYMMTSSRDFNNGQLHGRFKLLDNQEKTKIFMDLGAGGLVGDQAESYFILPQAYVQYKPSERWNWTFGRSVRSYSDLDEYWMLGDVQPVFRWDVIRPELQGLSGVFLDYKVNRYLELNFYGSYLYLPTQGASYSIVEGKLTSSNPWFAELIDSLVIAGQPYDLSYRINTPSVSDVVFQPNLGVGFRLQSEDERFWMRAHYFSKTRNDLVLPFGVNLNIGNQTASVAINPTTAQHRMTAVDFGYRSQRASITLSGIYESDIDFDTDGPGVRPEYSDQYKVALRGLAQVNSSNVVEVGLLRTFKNNITVILDGVSNTFDLDAYSLRNQYENAVDVRWSSSFSPRPHGFLYRTKVRYAYDYKAETSLLSLELDYRPVAEITLFALSDLFGGTRDTNDVYNNLLVNYLNRDRVQAGVRYVF